jgi:hypothetical protein
VTITAGGENSLTASGFRPGEQVAATLHSTPVDLGTYTASASGIVAFTFTVPATLEPGNHTVTLLGLTSGRAAAAGLTVIAPTTTTGLADTGGPIGDLSWLASVLIVAGTSVLFVTRRHQLAQRQRQH